MDSEESLTEDSTNIETWSKKQARGGKLRWICQKGKLLWLLMTGLGPQNEWWEERTNFWQLFSGLYMVSWHACAHTHRNTDIYTHSTHTIINNNNNTLIDINLKITRMFLCVKRRLQRYPKPSTHTFTEHNNLESQCIISNVGLSPLNYFRKFLP